VQITSGAGVNPVKLNASFCLLTDMTGAAADTITAPVHQYDVVQLNNQGPLYSVSREPTVNSGAISLLELSITLNTGQLLPWPQSTTIFSSPVPYKIYRQPVGAPGGTVTTTKSHAPPLQLPARAIVDLEFSGVDPSAPFISTAPAVSSFWQAAASPTQPVAILFSPNGSLEGFYYEGTAYRTMQPIYLLVGKRERSPSSTAENNIYNPMDLDNIWVIINPQTGLVTTAEVSGDPAGPSTIYSTYSGNVNDYRWFAKQQAQSMGGR
jgi:hypothetical protein